MLMLSLDDAVKVTQWLVEDGMNDDEIIRQELEQKFEEFMNQEDSE